MTMKGFLRILSVVALVLVVGRVPVFAGGQLYLIAPNAPFWADDQFPVPYNINPQSAIGYVAGDDPAQQFADAVVSAFTTWSSIPTSRITFARGPDSSDLLDTDPNDGVNLIVFHNSAIVQGIEIPLPAGVLGITNTVFDFDTGRMQGAAITLNTDPLPDNPDPDWSTSGEPGSVDIEATVLHEAGHFQGMCHSAVRNDVNGDLVGRPSHAAVMFPFLAHDVMDGRTPDADDIAWQGFIYPASSYASTFGTIEGDVPFGSTMLGCGQPKGANGAHVVARDLDDLVGGQPRMIVGTYSYTADGSLGRYKIPGLPAGNYGVWIEPLDGSPVSALQINSRIQFTTSTKFPEDWYSGDSESGTETDPGNPSSAVEVPVSVGSTTSGIDVIIENSVPAGCMIRTGNGKAQSGGLAGLAASAIFLLPLAFIVVMKRRYAAKA
jgi:hypothetical protein